MKQRKKTKSKGFFLKITDEEEQIIQELKDKYALNISQFIRISLADRYKKFKEEDEKT